MGGDGNVVNEAELDKGLPLEVGVRLDLVVGGGNARVAQNIANQKHVVVAAIGQGEPGRGQEASMIFERVNKSGNDSAFGRRPSGSKS